MRTPEQFWSKVRVGTEEECWPFLGAKDGENGYGNLRERRKIKLSRKAVMDIRKSFGITKNLAEKYGVTARHIRRIQTRSSQRWVE